MREPTEMISDYIDGCLADSETAELEAWLLADSAHAQLFARTLQLHSQLRDALAGEVSMKLEQLREPGLFSPMEASGSAEESGLSLDDAMIIPAIHDTMDTLADEAITPPASIRPVKATANAFWRPARLSMAAAALILLALGIVFMFSGHHSPATLGAVVDAQWDAPNGALHSGELLPLDPLYLKSGTVQINFQNGVAMILEGPARFQIRTDNGADLALGKLTAAVPLAGHGFAIHTASAQIVDLGTEFGVEVGGDGVTDVEVFQGKVQAAPAVVAGAPSPVTLLTEGQSASVTTAGVGPVSKNLSQRFVRKLASGVQSLDLVDLMAGGDGMTQRPGVVIDTANATAGFDLQQRTESGFGGDRAYHRVSNLPALDGCFVPDGTNGPMQVDSAGDLFHFPPTNGRAWGNIWAVNPTPFLHETFRTHQGASDTSHVGHRFIHVNVNGGVTVDLSVARRLHPDRALLQFNAIVGNTFEQRSGTWQPLADAYVLVDGEQRFVRSNFSPLDGVANISIPLQPGDRFLTMATTAHGTGIESGWVVFADPVLTCGDK